MNPREHRERPPDRRLTDAEILVGWSLWLLMRRDTHAGAQPQLDEAEQRGQLVVGQRILGVIGARDRRGGPQRVAFVEHRVRDRDCKVGNGVAMDRVAKIKKPG
jgi:hypothetical protein